MELGLSKLEIAYKNNQMQRRTHFSSMIDPKKAYACGVKEDSFLKTESNISQMFKSKHQPISFNSEPNLNRKMEPRISNSIKSPRRPDEPETKTHISAFCDSS